MEGLIFFGFIALLVFLFWRTPFHGKVASALASGFIYAFVGRTHIWGPFTADVVFCGMAVIVISSIFIFADVTDRSHDASKKGSLKKHSRGDPQNQSRRYLDAAPENGGPRCQEGRTAKPDQLSHNAGPNPNRQRESEHKPTPSGSTIASNRPSELDADVKLDLARAYISTGSPDAARTVIEEVIRDGSEEEKSEARRLLSDL